MDRPGNSMGDGKTYLALTRGAMAVLEEVRREPWAEKPTYGVDGYFVVVIPQSTVEMLHQFVGPTESPSDAILRAYREGRFPQPRSRQ